MTTLYQKHKVRLHLTNIASMGAVRLLQSLLPSLIQSNKFQIEQVYISEKSEFKTYLRDFSSTQIISYIRYLPNSISRFLECTFFGSFYNGDSPLLVLGDIPIRCKSKQIVFVQSSLLTVTGNSNNQFIKSIKYRISKWIFKSNSKYVSTFIVQTNAMKIALENSYPEIKNRIHVIAQPAPRWLISSGYKHQHIKSNDDLKLFYPAASYPHKNHQILSQISQTESTKWPINSLLLTIPISQNPNNLVKWIECCNTLTPDEILASYKKVDGLLFLSLTESYGIPLVEAMWIGLPIICPDLPYARELCGDQAIYFNPTEIDSLKKAIFELRSRKNAGVIPNWSKQLAKIPTAWEDDANAMLEVTVR